MQMIDPKVFMNHTICLGMHRINEGTDATCADVFSQVTKRATGKTVEEAHYPQVSGQQFNMTVVQ